MFRRITKFHMLLLAGCILFAGCAASSGEENIPGSAGVNIAAGTDGENPAQDSAGQDGSASGASSVPGGTTQIPEGMQTSGAGEACSAREDKKPRPEVGEKKIHLDMYSRIKVVGGDTLLVYGNKEVLLLDMYTLEVLKREDNEAYGNIFSISAVCGLEDGGYRACGKIDDEASPGRRPLVMIDYDSELQAGSVLNLDEMLGQILSGQYKFLDSGQKLLYVLNQNQKSYFYLYDIQSGEITKITPQRDISVSSFRYLEGVNRILFRGDDENNQGVIGRMDMDGKILDINSDHYYGSMWDFQDFALIKESVPMEKEGECAFFYYDFKDGSIRSFPLVEGNKTAEFSLDMTASPSSEGKYYVTFASQPETRMRYKTNIYESVDGCLIGEIQLSIEEFGEGVKINDIYIDDETERMILYGSWTDRPLETWLVSKDLFPRQD